MTPPAREIFVGDRAQVEEARRIARSLAGQLGFAAPEAEMLVLATSELATNLYRYARSGRLRLAPVHESDRVGVELTSGDDGPGITDLDAALRDGFSTGGGLGNGLPAVRRLMDDFAIASAPTGTTITARKWRRTK